MRKVERGLTLKTSVFVLIIAISNIRLMSQIIDNISAKEVKVTLPFIRKSVKKLVKFYSPVALCIRIFNARPVVIFSESDSL